VTFPAARLRHAPTDTYAICAVRIVADLDVLDGSEDHA